MDIQFSIIILQYLFCICASQATNNQRRLDVLIGVISSDSVSEVEFAIQKQFVLDVLAAFSQFGECGVKVAMINYGGSQEISWDFASPIASQIDLLADNIIKLKRIGGSVKSMVPVINIAANKIFNHRNDRSAVENIFVLINSDASQSIAGLKEAMKSFKRVGSSALVIGVTNQTSEEELNIIAVTPERFLLISDYYRIVEELRMRLSKNCNDCPNGYTDEDLKPGQSFYKVLILRKPATDWKDGKDGQDVLGSKKPVTVTTSRCIYIRPDAGTQVFFVYKYCVQTKYAATIKFRGYDAKDKLLLIANNEVRGNKGKSYSDTCHTFRVKWNNLKLLKYVKVTFVPIDGQKSVVVKDFYMDACGDK